MKAQLWFHEKVEKTRKITIFAQNSVYGGYGQKYKIHATISHNLPDKYISDFAISPIFK